MSVFFRREIKYYGFIILTLLCFEMFVEYSSNIKKYFRMFHAIQEQEKIADGKHFVKRKWQSTVDG
jgi:hypothetical protein